ncbi:MAG: protein kinase [Planctomycetes bacterium]|jgi:serine/threonine protein kinase|nr:protein kinase [Planctomycetota bacterium]HPY74060.1 FHA domain-containing serine/threonine-protein kinase [Planctomycetota bacterium]HQA99606.1 FHA domain-containing serine/threonine-protein kinase [Planctomycetota bacterium]
MQAKLNIYRDNQQISQILIDSTHPTSIGRHPDCTLTFKDTKISARHCVIEPKNNYFYIVDQNSTNGTYVNNKRVRIRRLYNNDKITCGGITIHFQWADSSSDDSTNDDINLVELIEKKDKEKQDGLEDWEAEREKIGEYKIIKKIGQGGIGEVYKAEHYMHPGFPVAIKILNPNAQQNTTLRERFYREAKVCMSTLNHPRIIKVLDVGIHHNRYFLAMEYIDGQTLDQYLKKKGAMSAKNALKITGHIALGLSYAHAHNIIHRDLKPGNIMLEANGHNVKIIDFGLAKMLDETTLTMTNHLVGTPRYMAPEQMKRSRDVDPRVDIYSLGAILYHMLGGLAPYSEIICNNRIALLRYMYANSPLPLNELPSRANSPLPSIVIKFVDKAMAKRPEDRFSSAKEMYNVIYKLLQQLKFTNSHNN